MTRKVLVAKYGSLYGKFAQLLNWSLITRTTRRHNLANREGVPSKKGLPLGRTNRRPLADFPKKTYHWWRTRHKLGTIPSPPNVKRGRGQWTRTTTALVAEREQPKLCCLTLKLTGWGMVKIKNYRINLNICDWPWPSTLAQFQGLNFLEPVDLTNLPEVKKSVQECYSYLLAKCC